MFPFLKNQLICFYSYILIDVSVIDSYCKALTSWNVEVNLHNEKLFLYNNFEFHELVFSPTNADNEYYGHVKLIA